MIVLPSVSWVACIVTLDVSEPCIQYIRVQQMNQFKSLMTLHALFTVQFLWPIILSSLIWNLY